MCVFKSECTFYSVTHFDFACEKKIVWNIIIYFSIYESEQLLSSHLNWKKARRVERCNFLSLFLLYFFWRLDEFADKMNESNTEIGNSLHTQNTHIQAYRRFARIRLHLPWSLFLMLVLTKRCSTNFSLLKPFLSCWNCFYIGRFFCILFSQGNFFFVSFNFIPSTFCATVCELLECRFPLSFFCFISLLAFCLCICCCTR